MNNIRVWFEVRMKKIMGPKGWKITGITIAILIVLIIAAIILRSFGFLGGEPRLDEQGITISLFNYNYEDPLLKEVEITHRRDANYLRRILERYSAEDVQQAILAEVIIDFNEGTRLFFSFRNQDYVFIENRENNVRRIISMPSGLIDFVNNQLEIED